MLVPGLAQRCQRVSTFQPPSVRLAWGLDRDNHHLLFTPLGSVLDYGQDPQSSKEQEEGTKARRQTSR